MYPFFFPKDSDHSSFRMVTFIRALFMLLFWSIVYTADANTLDSLIQTKIGCNSLKECYQNKVDICRATVKYDSRPSFIRTVPELLRYMDLIDEKPTWLEGYMEIANGYQSFNDFRTADSVFQVALGYCTKPDQFHDINIARARVMQRMSRTFDCVALTDSLLGLLEDGDWGSKLPEIYLLRGKCYLDGNDIFLALKDFIKVKELCEGNPLFEIEYDNAEELLVKTYTELKSFEASLDIYRKKRLSNHRDGNYKSELFSYFHIINALLELKRYGEVISVGHKAIHLKNKHKVSTAFGYIYYGMGEAFFAMNQLDSALHYSDKGIVRSRRTNEKKELADNLFVKGKVLIERGGYGKAKDALEEAMGLLEYNHTGLSSAYAKVMAKLGEFDVAYDLLRANWDSWEGSQAEDEPEKIAALLVEERFKIEKEQQLSEFQYERKSERMWVAIGALLLFLILIGMYIYWQMENTKKLKELNHSLRHHNQALEQFAHITSHDLKEPVRNISSFASLLMRNSKDDKYNDDEREYISFIQSNAKNLYRMIESIKKFTEVSFSNHKSEAIEVTKVFKVVEQNLRQVIYENNTVLEFHNPQSIEVVQFPKDLLIVTLQNLVQNGIKYNHSETPKIEVTISERQQKTVFKISDNGIGIDKEFHAQIFIPFKTLENKVNNQSSGLGLSICKNILENHGGDIWVESDGASGSSFYFSI